MTPLDYYLWVAVKAKYYVDKPETFDALRHNIHEAIGEIRLHTIDNVLKNWTDCVDYSIQLSQIHKEQDDMRSISYGH